MQILSAYCKIWDERTYWLADEEAVFMEYIRHVEGEEDLTVGELLEVREGLIVGSRVYHA